MTTSGQKRSEIERLQAVVDVHGGDRERWPAADRLALGALVAHDDEAAAIVREALALDRLLNVAPALSPEREARLAQRIVAAAVKEGRWGGETSSAQSSVAVPQRQHIEAAEVGATATGLKLPPRARVHLWGRRATQGPWQSAVMMVLALGVGVLAGATLLAGDAANSTFTLADASEDVVLQQLVAGDETLDAIAEDLL
ncbi:MAG: hypothetical protein KDJ47_07005 [Hyphomicrobiaceae bacterium]|nr:hypothetical protein [Hyphomicrobiaceae bacterium]